MINSFLQILKRQQLAILFARYDCLELLRNFSVIGGTKGIARFFLRKSRESLENKLEKMMFENNNPLLNIFITELAYDKKILLPTEPKNTPLIYDGEMSNEEGEFFCKIFREMVRHSSRQKPLYNSFRYRSDILLDKRLFGAELEKLLEKTAFFQQSSKFEIDWKLTTKEDIFIISQEGSFFTDKLTKTEQKDLVQLWGYLFYEKNMQVFAWRNIIRDNEGRINFYTIDSLREVDEKLKNFSVKYLRNEAIPKEIDEYKLASSLRLLQKYCPDVNLEKEYENYIKQAPYIKQDDTSASKDYIDSLKKTEFGLGLRNPLPIRDAQSIAYLLDSRREMRRKKYQGNPLIRILLPLIMFLYALYLMF